MTEQTSNLGPSELGKYWGRNTDEKSGIIGQVTVGCHQNWSCSTHFNERL